MHSQICTLVWIVCLALHFFLLVQSGHAQTSESFAILDFEAEGVSEVEVRVLADRLEAALVSLNTARVIERGKMHQILKEQDFQISGCTSNECAVEVGELLGVTLMVAGSIGKIGSTFSINLRTIEVSTGEIIQSIMRDYRGEIDGLLGEMLPIANELAGFSGSAATQAATPQAAIPIPVDDRQSSSPINQQTMILTGEVSDIHDIELIEDPPALKWQPDPASPIGGSRAIRNNLRYPPSARSKGIEGTVVLICYVDKTGTVTKAAIKKSMPEGMNEAAIIAVQKTRFKPASRSNGNPIGSWVPIAVHFNEVD